MSTRAPSPSSPLELDELTLARAQRGDRAAAHAFVVTYQDRVYGLVTRVMYAHPHLVDDLAQDVFVRALGALGRFDRTGPARLSTWVLTIATRLCLDVLKRVTRAPPTMEPPSFTSVEDVVDQRQRGRRVAEVLGSLPDDQRTVLVLRAYHGLDVREVAHLLGVEEGTVKSRLSRARAALRALVSGGEHDA